MKAFDIFKCVMGLTLMLLMLRLGAQPVPGEDPVTLNQKVMREMLPLNPVTPAATQSTSQEIPSWLEAKVARLVAKAYSADTSGIQTDENVVTTMTTNGLQKICTQDLASNTAAAAGTGRYGPKTDPQIVVLRGDLVNICR
jgi:hypothetical protein